MRRSTAATGARRVPAKGDRLFVRVLQINDDGKVAFSTLGLDAAAVAEVEPALGVLARQLRAGVQLPIFPGEFPETQIPDHCLISGRISGNSGQG